MGTYLAGLDGITAGGLDSPLSPNENGSAAKKANALSSKLSTVLSSSYADPEIREALRLFDRQDLHQRTRNGQNLKSIAEKEVIDANARILEDFGDVAEVCPKIAPKDAD